MEVGAGFDATQSAVKAVQAEYLEKVRKIRQSMVEGSSAAASSKEFDTLRAENESLKKENLKQEYRIQHLVQVVEDLLEEKKGS